MNEAHNSKGTLVIISGPSGVGKSTICKEAAKQLDNVYISISVTTRPRAETETDSKDYWFVTEGDFQEKVDKGLLLEHAGVFGYLYGTPKDKVEQALATGKTVILEIDVQGGRLVKAQYPDAIMIFILPPTQKELVERLQSRGREDSGVAKERLGGADAEIAAAWQYYEHLVINDSLEQAVAEVAEIIKSKTV